METKWFQDAMWRSLHLRADTDRRTTHNVWLEAFAATEFNEIFSGRQPRQAVKVFRCFRNFPRQNAYIQKEG